MNLQSVFAGIFGGWEIILILAVFAIPAAIVVFIILLTRSSGKARQKSPPPLPIDQQK